MPRRTVLERSAPQPTKKPEPKKQVRFSLPEKTTSVRPAQCVSTHNTERKRSSTVHSRGEKRPSKRARHPEPVLVAPGLSTGTRAREVERPREMAKAKAKTLSTPRRSSVPAAIVASRTPTTPRREQCTYLIQGGKKLSTQLKPSEVLGGGKYDWARVTRRTIYGWYNK